MFLSNLEQQPQQQTQPSQPHLSNGKQSIRKFQPNILSD